MIKLALNVTHEEGFPVLYWYICHQFPQLLQPFKQSVIAGFNPWIKRPSEALQFWGYSKHYASDHKNVPSECRFRKDTHLTTNQYVFTSCCVSGTRKLLADITGCVSLFEAPLKSVSLPLIRLSTIFYIGFLAFVFPQNLALQRFPVGKWLRHVALTLLGISS